MTTDTIKQWLEHLPNRLESGDYQTILAEILSHFDCETGTLHRLDPSTGMLELVAQLGIPAMLLDKINTIPVGKGIAGAAAQQKAPVQMCNLQNDQSGIARPDAKKTQVAGSLAVPILKDGALCGTLGIGKQVPYDFGPEETAQLETIASALVSNKLL